MSGSLAVTCNVLWPYSQLTPYSRGFTRAMWALDVEFVQGSFCLDLQDRMLFRSQCIFLLPYSYYLTKSALLYSEWNSLGGFVAIYD